MSFSRACDGRRAERRRDGSFIVVVAAGLMGFLGMASLVTDMGFSYTERNRGQTVLDMAVLATMGRLNPATSDADLNTEASATVTNIATGNFLDAAEVTAVTFTRTGTAGASKRGGFVTANATVEVSALLGTLFGMTTYSVALTSTATGEYIPPDVGLNGFGMFGCADFEISEGAFIDAYNSNNGPYEGPPNHTAGTTPAYDGTKWSDDLGYGLTSPACASGSGTNCSARVVVGSFGDAAVIGGSTRTHVYGSIWSDVAVDINNAASNYVDRDVLCSNCPISIGSAVVHGDIDTTTPSPNLSLCDDYFLMPSTVPASLFEDTVNSPHQRADLTATYNVGGTFQVEGKTYELATEFVTPNTGGNNKSYTLEAGKVYHLEDWDYGNNGTVNIIGDIATNGYPIVYLEGDHTEGGHKDVNQMDWGKAPTFNLSGVTSCSVNPCPSGEWSEFVSLRILASPTIALINFKKDNSNLVSVDIVAPKATCEWDKDMAAGGRVICGEIDAKKDSVFHYDEALGGGFYLPPTSYFFNIRLTN